jgi:hypothetical protein
LGRMLLSALRLETFYCKENRIQGQKGVQ